MSREAVLAKLCRVFGAPRADEIVVSTMTLAGISSLETPHERLRFAKQLIKGGGVYAAIGNSMAVQALLEGGGKHPSGTFQSAQKLAR